jgi:hypothetical protein
MAGLAGTCGKPLANATDDWELEGEQPQASVSAKRQRTPAGDTDFTKRDLSF